MDVVYREKDTRLHLRLVKWAAILCLVFVGTVISTAVLTWWESNKSRTLPAPSGLYPVGRRSLAWRNDKRADPLGPTSGPRELFAWVWYPAEAQDTEVAPYIPDAWLRAFSRSWLDQRLDRVKAHAYERSEISGAAARWPVLVFSPGSGQLPSAYTSIAEDLASNGYVIVVLAHTFSTPVVVFPDSTVRRASESRYRGDLGLFLQSVWAADLSDAVDFLHHQQQLGDSFANRIDLEQVGALGHSFGGAAALETCHLDHRFRACIDLDGTVYGPAAETGIKQPILLLMQKLKPPPHFLRQRWERFWDNQGREDSLFQHSCAAYRLTVPKLLHMNLSDEGFFFKPEDRFAELIGTRLDGRATLLLESSVIRSFFGEYLQQPHPIDLSEVSRSSNSHLESHHGC